jgi:hypothetical protein
MPKLALKDWIINTLGIGEAKNAAHYREKWLRDNHPHRLAEIIQATNFLDIDSNLSFRIFCILNDVESKPICDRCNAKPTKFCNGKIQKYCSVECASSSPDRQKKRKITNLMKYGVEHAQQNESVKRKREQTCLRIYGETNPTKNQNVKKLISEKSKSAHSNIDHSEYAKRLEKYKKTNLERFGVEFAIQNEKIKEKSNKTCLEKYGVDNPSKSEEIKNKIKNTNMSRYGVPWGLSNDGIRKKIVNTLKEKCGVEHPSQIPDVRRKAEQTTLERLGVCFAAQSDEIQERMQQKMLERYGVKWATQTHIPPDSIIKLNDIEWLKNANQTKSLTEISKELGVGDVTVGIYFRKHGIEPIYHYRSSGKIELCSFLKESGVVDYECNIRGIIGKDELDIFIPEKRIAIEYHGIYWHSENISAQNRIKHFKLWQKCHNKGIRLFQIYEHEWLDPQKKLIWKNILSASLGKFDSIYARKCFVIELNPKEVKTFYDSNHLQGMVGASSHFGLLYEGRIIAAMSFRTSKGQSELIRFCSLLGVRVVGGASKLLMAYVKKYKPKEIVTFSDNRYSSGNLYNTLGFDAVANVPPRYIYVHGNTHEEMHRRSFQKQYLNRIIPNYDSSLTEWENVKRSLWLRIWDAGKIKWILKQ